MINYFNLFISFLIGAIGSLSYPILVKLGFAGGKTPGERYKVLKPFLEGGWIMILLYCFFGGFISAVLQWLTIDVLVPLQSLIAGITWPIFVSGFLSGRQSELYSVEKEPVSSKLVNNTPVKDNIENEKMKQSELFLKKNIKDKDSIYTREKNE